MESCKNISMKESGIGWAGQIPVSWQTTQIKRVVKCLDGSRIPVDASMRVSGDIPYWGAGNIVDYVDTALFDEELVLLGEDGSPFFDRCRPVAFHITEPIWANNHIHVLRPIDIDPEYLTNVLNVVDYHDYIFGSIIPKLTQSDMMKIEIPYPPRDVQEVISGELGSISSSCDGIVDSINSTIDAYKELKQSIITEAVTKGLDLSIDMKDSGLVSVGNIPCEWSVKKLKHVSHCRGDILSEDTSPLYSFRYVDIGSVDVNDGITGYERMIFADAPSRARKIVKTGDVIISTVRPYLKAIANILDDEDVIVSTGFAVVVADSVDPLFLKYLLMSESFISEVISHSYGVSYPAITELALMDIKIPIPPVEIQKQIADYLDKTCVMIDRMIKIMSSIQETYVECKMSMIYEYVTGKVRLGVV